MTEIRPEFVAHFGKQVCGQLTPLAGLVLELRGDGGSGAGLLFLLDLAAGGAASGLLFLLFFAAWFLAGVFAAGFFVLVRFLDRLQRIFLVLFHPGVVGAELFVLMRRCEPLHKEGFLFLTLDGLPFLTLEKWLAPLFLFSALGVAMAVISHTI